MPLQDGHPAIAATSPTMAFDLITEWEGFSPLDATSYMFDNYVNQTTTLAWMNPGYDNAAKVSNTPIVTTSSISLTSLVFEYQPSNPPLTGSPNPGLIDYIVKVRMFNFYMNNACIPNTPDYTLMTTILQNNPWSKPIPVYGYGDTYPIAGDIFEAETDCTKEHNMGQIATTGVNNLSFFSRKGATTTPLKQNIQEKEVFNSSKTYVTFVLGDGDNVAFVKSSRRDWMISRLERCNSATKDNYLDCFPLVWSLSPHLLHFASDIIEWYYGNAQITGNDYFMLPPSGDLYSYPSEFPDDLQVNYVDNTAKDSYLMNTTGTVHWEVSELR